MMPLALTREISPAIARCELTHLARVAIDLDQARRQHEEYERALSEAGCRVHRLDAPGDLPDSVFIEDIAVVFDELAIVTRPGAESRRGEVPIVARALAHHRALETIDDPATVDGGDVLVVSRRVFVGRTPRTNAAGLEQLKRILEPFGYRVDGVAVDGCLHLKSAATSLGDATLLVNRNWVDVSAFGGLALIDVDPTEPSAANALRVGDSVIFPREHARTAERLRAHGLHVRGVGASELAKAEGGVTCCSLIVQGS